MDCYSFHNTHVTEKNNPVLYSQRCMNCHNADDHPLSSQLGAALTKNCIDCHIPVMPSRQISFQIAGKAKKAPYLLRNHQIAVYPGGKKIFLYIKSIK